jgi:DNA primase
VLTDNARIWLPKDSEPDIYKWPVAERLWLFKYGITLEEIANYGLVYSDYYRRIIFPVRHGGILYAYQGRSVGTAPPKWLYTGRDKSLCYINLDNHHASKQCVIVEDYVSAIKCARYTNAVCSFGTTLRDAVSNIIKQRYTKFIIYFDNDNYIVKKKQRQLARELSPYGEVVILREDKDPKEMGSTELEELLL